MSDPFNKKLEAAAYVAIILLALVTAAVLAKKFLLAGAGRPDPRIAAGTKLSLPGVDWAERDKTMLLVLSTDCRYCTESAPFYQRVAAEAARLPNVRLVAALPQPPGESREYLSRHGVAVGAVVQALPPALGVAGTPTLILVDRSGAVVRSWVGKLPEGEEAAVLTMLAG